MKMYQVYKDNNLQLIFKSESLEDKNLIEKAVDRISNKNNDSMRKCFWLDQLLKEAERKK
jgi:hypothetical protein